MRREQPAGGWSHHVPEGGSLKEAPAGISNQHVRAGRRGTPSPPPRLPLSHRSVPPPHTSGLGIATWKRPRRRACLDLRRVSWCEPGRSEVVRTSRNLQVIPPPSTREVDQRLGGSHRRESDSADVGPLAGGERVNMSCDAFRGDPGMIGLIEDERGTSWFRLRGFDISDAGSRKLDSCYQEVWSKKENSSNLATGTRWWGGGCSCRAGGCCCCCCRSNAPI